jgi:hypothetical protein
MLGMTGLPKPLAMQNAVKLASFEEFPEKS